MNRSGGPWTARAVFLACACSVAAGVWLAGAPAELEGRLAAPARLSDREFWRLASGFSEADGAFHSENLVSNELGFQAIVPQLERAVVQGRAYVGVGSEQNFTYIAAARPALAFIVDIRRGNFDLHLLYKALFELSADRADFVSRLFSRKRPAGLGPASSAPAIFAAYEQAAPSQALYARNLEALEAHLTARHGFPLSRDDRRGIEFVYNAWFTKGPDIHYELTTGGFGGGRGGPGGFPSYADLMTTTDGSGRNRSYLATEASFGFLKDLETRNMIVPVVGNFGGPKALRAVASYLRQTGMTVSAFYVSNVEQYLRQDGLWTRFCTNASAMPVDGTSVFIRSTRSGFGGQTGGGGGPGGFGLALSSIAPEVAGCIGR
jgi:hypothetical protein